MASIAINWVARSGKVHRPGNRHELIGTWWELTRALYSQGRVPVSLLACSSIDVTNGAPNRGRSPHSL